MPDCDGSEYCQAERHIPGCFCGPHPNHQEDPEPVRMVAITPRHALAIEAAERLMAVCNPDTASDLREVLRAIEEAANVPF